MENIDKIYCIVHPEFEPQRFTRVVQNFQRCGIPMEKTLIGAATWGSQITSKVMYTVWDPFLRLGKRIPTWKDRCLSRNEISLMINFYEVVRDAVEHGYKYVLTFESDTYLRSDFRPKFDELWTDLSGKPWDFVSLGEGIGTRPADAPYSYWSSTRAYTPPHWCVFRCTDSMLFRVSFLAKVVQTMIPFGSIIDWEMNFQLAGHKGVALWADPPLAEQGSCFARDTTLLPA